MFRHAVLTAGTIRAAFALCVVGVAPAITRADTFTGVSHAHFQTPTPVGSIFTISSVGAGESNNKIVSGTSGGGFTPNELQMDSLAFTGVSDNSPFAVSSLRYYNGSTTGAATDFPIGITLTFTTPAIDQSFDFSFHLDATPNSATPLSNPANDDFLTVPVAFAANAFTYNGAEYTLKLLGFSVDNGATIVSQFRLPEEKSVSSTLYAVLTAPEAAAEVPLPGVAVGGIVLLGGMGIRRRFQRIA